jgi:PAS domain S-box-containing protein
MDQENFFEMSIDMFFIAGFDGHFKLVNPACEATLGFTPDELVGRPFIEFVHPDDVEATNALYARIGQGADVVDFELRFRCKNGSYRWLLWDARTLPDRQLVYAVAHDFTAMKSAEDALVRKTRELERNNAELDDFTHVVSHDLKEPLRGIEAFSSFLAEEYGDKMDVTGRHYVDVIKHSAARLRDLIEDLLELSRFGHAATQSMPVDLDLLVREMRDSMAFTLAEKRAEIDVPEKLPSVICERTRFMTVFENLVTNAIKYNDKPTPVIQITHVDCRDAFLFCIRDNGPGIAPENRQKVFGIFQRLVRRDEQEGTGIGLAICKTIVEGRGGAIWIESNANGEGCSFYFTIPVALPEYEGQELVNARR